MAYKPGVADPVGKSALVAIRDMLGRELGPGAAVYTSILYLIEGVDTAQAERIALELLANPVIQTVEVKSRQAWDAAPPSLAIPKIEGGERPQVKAIDLSGSDPELEAISRKGMLALSLAEMKAIRDHFAQAAGQDSRRKAGLGPDPTDVELECLAQTWSEHCKHKIFNAEIEYLEEGQPPERVVSLFNSYIRRATEQIHDELEEDGGSSWLVSVFHDNAGVVTFDNEIHLVYKVETHNSPSALDPYGGAITGIVGVNRDPFGTGRGADLLANVWGYCFATPFYRGRAAQRDCCTPSAFVTACTAGSSTAAIRAAFPYGRGWEIFDNRYLGKPLVFCGTVGSLPVEIAG